MRGGYKRTGTTTLFAALNMLDGGVIGECIPATETTRKCIRRGVFKSVDELKQAIIDYLDKHNDQPKPYVKGQLIVRRHRIRLPQVGCAHPQHRTRASKPPQLPPRDCSPQALLGPHNDGLLYSNQKRGIVDEFHTESDTIQILAKVDYPIAGDIRSA